MGHTCTPEDLPRQPAPDGEHPVTAVLAVVAIILAVLLIALAGLALHGTDNLASLVDEDAAPHPAAPGPGAAEDEAASSRWATGFSH